MNSEQVFHTKQSLLLEGLAEGLFGHIMVTSTFWDRVGQHLEEYLALCERRNSVKQGLEQLNSVIFHHHLSKFPVSKVHLKEVIEWVQNNLQILGHQLTLPIDAKELLATDNLVEPKYIFKSLRRNLHREDTIVTLLEENEIIGNGTTGLTSWQGALFLTDWFLGSSPEGPEGHVLELGSGVGFLGMHLIKSFPKIKSYLFTDTHPQVLKTALFNIRLNFDAKITGDTDLLRSCSDTGPPKGPQEQFPWHFDDRLRVEKLDWTQFTGSESAFNQKVDYILGADIVYERSLIAPLCSVLKKLILNNPEAKALIACTERSTTTLNCFEEELKKIALNFAIVGRGFYTPAESLFCSDVSHQHTRIYQVEAELA